MTSAHHERWGRLLLATTAAIMALLGTSFATAQVCGDGIVEVPEECDDGDLDDGDGCDSGCVVEDGYICTEASFEIDFFEDWSAQGFLAGPTTWTLSQDNLTVTQTQNSGPGVAMTNLPAVGVTIEFELEVQTTGDDDFIGWTVGYESGDHSNPNAEYMIFDWKQADQNCDGWGYDGLAMNRVTGIPTLSGGCDNIGNFWSHADAVSEEARAINLGSTGWGDNTTYLVELQYEVDHVQVWVDGALEFDEVGTFPVGNFGFYTLSQPDDRFTLVSPTGSASVCGLDPDQDPDGDGVPSGDDPAPWDPNICGDWNGDGWDDCTDTDGDGVLDFEDNCVDDPNPDQEDLDVDGIGDACDPDADGDDFDAGPDCDDMDDAIHPDATEMCDGVDNDCDGTVDEADAADASTWYADVDQDGFGDPATATPGCTQPAGYVADNTDCDDTDAAQYPGADEFCNGEDDDCDGAVDEDEALDVATWYADTDQDGFGDPGISDIDCDQPPGYVADGTDCDDGDAAQYPGADEFCNGEDDDCDGVVDEDDALDAQTWWADLDGDGFGDAGISQVACDAPANFVGNPDDCDDGDASQYPGADEICNGEDDDCDGAVDEDEALDVLTWYEDYDLDGFGSPLEIEIDCDQPQGYVADNTDCDDTDASQYPGADEICNGEDDDCDGAVDEDDALDVATWYEDFDGDGFGDPLVSDVDCDQPIGYVADSTDCDDADPLINPAAEEICDGVDNDCDALTDELVDGDGDTFSICDGDCDDWDPDVNPDAEEVCDGIDNDCDPATDEEVDGDGDGFTTCQDDCDDDDAAMFPGNTEVCDGLDNDCDGVLPADEADDDGDGMSECAGDCDDADAWTYDGAPEQCDQLDNDCDGVVDNGVDEDLDGDGFNACQGDCDNNDPNVYPFAPEICDGKDDDCDGDLPLDEVDEDGDGWLVCDGDCDDADADLNLDDADGDLWTSCDGDCDDADADLNLDDSDGDGWDTCDGDCDDDDATLNLDDADGDLWTSCDGDCDDEDAAVNPDADEVCDGADNDCDGAADDVDADGDGYTECDDDCDDGDAEVNPDADEVCDDGIDNDCDELVDTDDGECEESGDDDDTSGDDDTDDEFSGGCDCENNQANTGPAAVPGLLLFAMGLALIRRRG